MNLAEQFDRLDKLIIDRSPDVAAMRNILDGIRQYVEAHEQDAEKLAALDAAHSKLQSEHAKLKAAQAYPTLEVKDKAPMEPPETLL